MKVTLILLPVLLCFAAQAHSQTGSLAQINTLIEQGWCEQANQELDRHLAGKNPDHQALFLKAKANLYLGQLEEAQEWGEKAVDAAPDSAEYWAQLGTIKAFRVRRSPMKGITLGRSSRKNYEKALELDPRNLNALQSLMMFRLYAPGIVGGDKDKAREMAEQIMAVNPAQGHVARAQILSRLDHDEEKVRQEMNAAVAANPDDPELCYNLARTLIRQEQGEDALRYYKLGQTRDPDPAHGFDQLGGAYLQLRRFDEAQAIFEEMLAADPASTLAQLGLGRVLMARDKYEEAGTLFRALMASHPEYGPARYHLAFILISMDKEPKQAVTLLREYLDGNLNLYWPSRSLANWQLALALENLDQYDEAWESISLALELSRGNDQMKRDAKRLEFMAKD